MNKIKKIVGASVVGAMILAPVGTAFATMTAANVENFYTMPFTLTRINYKYNQIGVIFRKKVSMLRMVIINPGYTEEYADERYETMGTAEIEWGKTIIQDDLTGFPEKEERFVMAPGSINLSEDSFGLIYYALEFAEGGHYEGKISYAPCNAALKEDGYNSSDYECRIHYHDGKASLSVGENGGTYMSSYTEAKYTGGNEVLVTYEYGLVREDIPLLDLPADLKSKEQKKAESEQGDDTQELLWQVEEKQMEIEYLRDELEAMSETNEALESLKNEISATVESQAAEIVRLQSELTGKDELREEELESLREELTAQLTASQAAVEYWQNKLNEKTEEMESLRTEMAEGEMANAREVENLENEIAELKATIAEREAALAAEMEKWQMELTEKEAAWEAQIEQKKAELIEKEAELSAKIAEIRETKAALQAKMEENADLEAGMAELEVAKSAEINALKTQLDELEENKAVELAVLKAELAELEAAKEADTDRLTRSLSELEAAKAEEQKIWAAKLAELEQKANREPETLTETVYVDREVAKEVEKDCAVASSSIVSEKEIGDGANDTGVEAGDNIAEEVPVLNKEAAKPWWALMPIAAGVCGLAYWWLASDVKLFNLKLKRKK